MNSYNRGLFVLENFPAPPLNVGKPTQSIVDILENNIGLGEREKIFKLETEVVA